MAKSYRPVLGDQEFVLRLGANPGDPHGKVRPLSRHLAKAHPPLLIIARVEVSLVAGTESESVAA